MKIFDRAPANWRDLQDLVGQLFEELGCEVQISTRAELVRGKKEIDVLVVDHGTVPASIYLIECKYWKSRVKQETVHAFRMVMLDQGAHRGFIISTAGFQAGAHEAAEKTNTNLMTFDELQETYFARWKLAMAKRHVRIADEVFRYWDPMGVQPARAFGPADHEVMALLAKAYEPYIALGPTVMMRAGELPLPMTIPVLDEAFVRVGEHTIETYRQFYDWIEANKDAAIGAYRKHLALDAPAHAQPAAAPSMPSATAAIAEGLLPPLPPLTFDDLGKLKPLAAEYDCRLQELALSSRNVHRGLHLRFVRTADDEWHALWDACLRDGTARLTARIDDTIFRCHELSDGEGTHLFLAWYFNGEAWEPDIFEHSMAFDDELDLSQADLDDVGDDQDEADDEQATEG